MCSGDRHRQEHPTFPHSSRLFADARAVVHQITKKVTVPLVNVEEDNLDATGYTYKIPGVTSCTSPVHHNRYAKVEVNPDLGLVSVMPAQGRGRAVKNFHKANNANQGVLDLECKVGLHRF